MNKKYELTDDTIIHQGRTLHRIKAVRDFGNVKVGDVGGYVYSEANLRHTGGAWISGNAKVFDLALVAGSGQVSGEAQISDSAEVFGNARVSGEAWVYDNAKIMGNATVSGGAVIYCNARVYGNARVSGDVCIFENAKISDDAEVHGNAEVYGNARVSGTGEVSGDTVVAGNNKVTRRSLLTAPVESKPTASEEFAVSKIEVAYALVLISAGNVAYTNGIPATDAWSREYETEHVEYLTDHGIAVDVVQAMLDKPLMMFIGSPTETEASPK